MNNLNQLQTVSTQRAEFYARRYEITGRELEAVLHAFGLTHREFGVTISKSRVTVCRMIAASGNIKIRIAQALEKLVGSGIYESIIIQYRENRQKRLDQAMKNRATREEEARLKKEAREKAKFKRLERANSETSKENIS